MIALDTHDAVLERFVRELDDQSPYPLGDPPDVGAYDPLAVEDARLAWAGRVIDEYRSVVVFSELLRLLSDAGAPFATLCAVQRVIGDELRHVQLCAQVVRWFGGFHDLRLDLSDLGLPPSSAPAALRAHEVVVRELVIAEGESVQMLRAYRDATQDPAIERVLQILLCDEARHFVAGRQLQAELERHMPPAAVAAAHRRLLPTVERDLHTMRRLYRESAADRPGRELGGSLLPDEVPFEPE